MKPIWRQLPAFANNGDPNRGVKLDLANQPIAAPMKAIAPRAMAKGVAPDFKRKCVLKGFDRCVASIAHVSVQATAAAVGR